MHQARIESDPADDPPAAWLIPSDEALVAAAQDDPRAFGALYDRYAEAIYRYCHRRLGNREAAEDATSQTFARALGALPTYRNVPGGFRRWLFAIAHNVIIDGLRRQGRHPEAVLDRARLLADPAPSPEERALAIDQQRHLQALLGALTPDQRRVIELRLAGLTSVEIAAVLGRRRGAVDVAQHRAIVRLRALLTAEDEDAAPPTGRQETRDVDR